MNEKLELQRIAQSHDVVLYQVIPDEGMKTLIASTPQVSQLLNSPEVCGINFQKLLSAALYNILNHLYKMDHSQLAKIMKSSPIDVLYILRGGLNFDLHRNVAEVTLTLPEVTFLSSQRVASGNGFEIGESTYRKWSIQDEALLCIGDICATATTLKNVIEEAIIRYGNERKKPSGLLIFTIGTPYVREMLIAYRQRLKDAWSPNFQGITVIYLEEIFSLYKGEPLLYNTHLPFTDFFRKDFPSSIEFEDVSLSKPVCFLERCAIYDGGSRSFEPSVYLSHLYNYWASLKQNATFQVIQLLELKSNLVDYQLGFEDWLRKRPWWNRMDKDKLHALHEKGQAALKALTSQSLSEICEGRLQMIKVKKDAHSQNN